MAIFEVKLTTSALRDIASLNKREHRIILDGIDGQLGNDPHVETRNRKRLRPNRTSEWEVRIGKYRVFYDVRPNERLVEVKVIGEKSGNRVVVRGEEYEL